MSRVPHFKQYVRPEVYQVTIISSFTNLQKLKTKFGTTIVGSLCTYVFNGIGPYNNKKIKIKKAGALPLKVHSMNDRLAFFYFKVNRDYN